MSAPIQHKGQRDLPLEHAGAPPIVLRLRGTQECDERTCSTTPVNTKPPTRGRARSPQPLSRAMSRAQRRTAVPLSSSFVPIARTLGVPTRLPAGRSALTAGSGSTFQPRSDAGRRPTRAASSTRSVRDGSRGSDGSLWHHEWLRTRVQVPSLPASHRRLPKGQAGRGQAWPHGR